MIPTLFMEKYPIFTVTIPKTGSRFSTTEAIVAYLSECIASDPVAAYIGTFDHYAHTQALGGEINLQMNDALMIIFCFGQKLPSPQMMAPRPRSIGVSDMGEEFVMTFLEAPVETINQKILGWIEAIRLGQA